AGAGGDRRQGHVACGRYQRGVLDPDRLYRDRHFPVPHPRAVRHGRCPGARPVPGRAAMIAPDFTALTALLLIPVVAAAVLAALPGYRWAARLNMLASFA